MVGEANTGFAPSDILNVWKTPVAQYWYLYALFFLFCIWTAFSGVLKNWQITLIVVLIGYVICQSGLRSYIASRILMGNGYDVYNFAGGFRFFDAVSNDRILTERSTACGMDK